MVTIRHVSLPVPAARGRDGVKGSHIMVWLACGALRQRNAVGVVEGGPNSQLPDMGKRSPSFDDKQ